MQTTSFKKHSYIWLIFLFQVFLLILCTMLYMNTFKRTKKHFVSDKYIRSQGFPPVMTSNLLGINDKKDEMEKDLKNGEFVYVQVNCSNIRYIDGKVNKFYYCRQIVLDHKAENKLLYMVGGPPDSTFVKNLGINAGPSMQAKYVTMKQILNSFNGKNKIFDLKNLIDAEKDNSKIEVLNYNLQDSRDVAQAESLILSVTTPIYACQLMVTLHDYTFEQTRSLVQKLNDALYHVFARISSKPNVEHISFMRYSCHHKYKIVDILYAVWK